MHPKELSMSLISRRRFLTTSATAAGGIALGCSDRSIVAPQRTQLGDLLPDPAASGIEHVIVFMMEIRSFDHFLGRAVPDWTSFDQYFCATLGPTFPNRIYHHSGQTDRIENSTAISHLPTIWD